MTSKEERFAQEYISDLNATRAAIRAGYTDNPAAAAVQANRLLRKAKVRERITTLQSDAAAAAMVTAEFVLSRLVAIVQRGMQAVPVRDRKGKETGVWRYDSAGAIRSLELLGDHLGMFKRDEESETQRRLAEAAEALAPTISAMMNAVTLNGADFSALLREETS